MNLCSAKKIIINHNSMFIFKGKNKSSHITKYSGRANIHTQHISKYHNTSVIKNDYLYQILLYFYLT